MWFRPTSSQTLPLNSSQFPYEPRMIYYIDTDTHIYLYYIYIHAYIHISSFHLISTCTICVFTHTYMYKCTNIYIYIILCSDPDSSGSSTAFVRGKVIPLKCPLPWGFHHYVGMPESDCLDVSENSGTPKSSHFK